MSRDIEGQLCHASQVGAVAEVKRLLAAGADSNTGDGSYQGSPLIRAARMGHVPVIAVLIKAGARPNGCDWAGQTPLNVATERGHTAAVEALITAGADVHLRDTIGNTALHTASRYGRLEAARTLLAAGAKPDARNKDGKRPVDMVRAHADLLDLCNHDHALMRMIWHAGVCRVDHSF